MRRKEPSSSVITKNLAALVDELVEENPKLALPSKPELLQWLVGIRYRGSEMKSPFLTEICDAGRDTHNRLQRLCECVCGRKVVMDAYMLNVGRRISCGCIGRRVQAAKRRVHGIWRSPLFGLWQKMLARCYNETDAAYSRYGGRGIKVCRAWWKFENFYADMGLRPDGLSLDRINNNKGYSPKNCRWATRLQQANNKRTNHLVRVDGQRMTVRQAADKFNLTYDALVQRLRKNGWNIRRAISNPIKPKKRKRIACS